jgi:ribonuclease D
LVITDDGEKLFSDFGILPAGLVELAALARSADPKGFAYARNVVALAKMVALYEGKQLLKEAVRCSDWEAVPLSAEQLECECRLLPVTLRCEDAKC